jgi:hypothetical protein
MKQLTAALEPEKIVLGGGNLKQLGALPPNYREGDKANAFLGGLRLWDNEKNKKGYQTWQK